MSSVPAKCIAVLGTGSAGMRHLEALRAMDSVKTFAIPARQDRVAELRSAGFDVAPNLQEAVDSGVTACIIATNTGRHKQDSLLAMAHDLDVLVEKPLAIDSSEAAAIDACARERRRKLFVGCVLRFSESLNTFRTLIAAVGELHSVRIECQSYLPDWRPARPFRESYSACAGEGGVLRDLIHEIDYAGWLFGWPTTVLARVHNLGRLGIHSDEVAELSWETAQHCIVSVGLDYLTRAPRRLVRALGERGTLEWNGIEQTVTLKLADAPQEIIRSAQTRTEMLSSQDAAFLNAVAGVNDERLTTGREGVTALAVCDAARLASSHRREEKVEQ